MAGIIAQLPGGEAQFVPLAPQLLAGAVLSEVARHLRRLLRPALGFDCKDRLTSEDDRDEVQQGGAACAACCEDEVEEELDFENEVADGDDEDDFRLLYRERDLEDETNAAEFLKAIDSGRPCFVRVIFRLLGGKGGFGALLRSQKGGKKTTNFDAMRDLNGRRVRHAKAVERIKTWIQEKKANDELVELLTGEGPELPTPTPEQERLDPEFVKKLKRAAASLPALVSQGMRRMTADGNGSSGSSAAAEEHELTKRARVDHESSSTSSTASKADTVDWLGALDMLGELSSTDGEDEAEEGSDQASASSGATATPAAPSKPAVSPVSAAPVKPVVSTPAPPKAAAAPEPVAQAATPATQAIHATPATEKYPAPPAKKSPLPAPKEPPQVFELVKPQDLAKYSSAEDLAAKVPAGALTQSLQALGLKCGGRPEDRAKRLFELKGKSFSDLPKSFFAPPANEDKD
mmetsp:Transcript_15389/g.24557  ORF Transcript_15389/g.24557 Transcript_15389/m.24557 type:complete len:462 (+) Transcript_15389:50-1435(+)